MRNIFKKKNNYKKRMLYVFSDMKLLIITLSIIMIWRWFWNFLDLYFLENYFVLSNLLSIIIWITIIVLLKLFHKDFKDFKF
jgi:sterol desaturase/sphingolipid hydroxylase (fatty acid hydroxylase superfamily)